MIWNGEIREICLWTIFIHDEFHGTTFQIFLEELPAAWQSKQHGSQVPVLCAWAMGFPGWLHMIPDTPPPPDNERLHEKTNETTTTTTHKYVWVSMIYMIFKGTKSLSLFLQRSIRGCYGLNHMPWKSIGSHWLRGFPARLAARGWKQWNCTWWARD